MPVRKLRRGEEMPEPWLDRGDPKLYGAIAGVWSFGDRWGSPRFPPGVYKHRSLESMNRLSEEWAEANFRAFRERLNRTRHA
ncbi:MAG: hypothetical protein HYX75_03535 [Acidobacteria bacterium]|nr:hypothetical protein [Acidobacteriota bacterium]